MWVRGGIGVVLCAVGAVWIGQGSGHIRGSFMTGERTWTVIGAVFVGLGALLLASAFVTARRRHA